MSSLLIQENTLNLYAKKIKQLISNRIDIKNEEWKQLESGLVLRKAKKNTLLITPQKRECFARLIIKGLIKIIHHDIEPYIFDFRKKEDFLCDVVSLTNKRKSNFSFVTVTDCEWIEIDMRQLLSMNNQISQVFSYYIVDYLNKGHRRASFLRIKNAEKRYQEFCKINPDIIQYAKQSEVASFLDITTQTLSRIRRNRVKDFRDKKE